MPGQIRDSGLQLELDNRLLILVFGLLIVICGGFFVLGFYLGKHQSLQAADRMSASSAAPVQNAPQSDTAAESNAGKKAVEVRPGREEAEWYRSVNKSENANRLSPAKKSGLSPGSAEPWEAQEKKSREEAAGPSASKAAIKSEAPIQKITYSVQVGAFRQRKEAETKASLLKAKNFPYVIEPPKTASGLFLLKVGRFESKPDAVAMKLRLQKNGFKGFVKPNQ
jgi:cell division protein FtsN